MPILSRRLILATMLAVALAAPAVGQGLRRDADPEAVVSDELVVQARTPGPALWRVSDADSTVWILGVPAGLPKGTDWNDRSLRAHLTQARELILPAQVRVAPLKAIGFFIAHRKDLRSKTPLEQSLPAEDARRFAAARESLGKPAKAYASWRPAIAGVILSSDFRRSMKLDIGEPVGHVRALARRVGVREQRAADYNGSQVLNLLITMSDEAHRQCLQDSVTEVSAGPDRIRTAARAWADGDVRGALTAERGYERCFAALPVITELMLRSQGDMADTIAGALARPGETVAVVELRSLVARGGVLDRLRARGVQVKTPATS